jgi:murein DD-endopeptidase MepM/ murein hydrolase activator NlpD
MTGRQQPTLRGALGGWLGLALVVAGLAGWLLGAPAAWSAPRGQRVIQPGDVATPTPTYTIILVPRPEARPKGTRLWARTPLPAPPGPDTAMRQAASQYVVRSGDTLLTVALEIGVDVSEMPCLLSPTFQVTQPLVIGDVITLPDWLGAGGASFNLGEAPPPGFNLGEAPPPGGGYRPMRCHQVMEGETLAQIAADYGVAVEQIRGEPWNGLAQVDAATPLPRPEGTQRYVRILAPLAVGRRQPSPQIERGGENGFLAFMLAQPVSVSPLTAYAVGGPRAAAPAGPVPKDWPYGSGVFVWPVYGWLSQGYREDHRAVDIAAPVGTFVTAADRGVVVRAGWNEQGYGLFVVIDHKIDYMTLYSHLSDVLVREGDVVAQGQVIGTVGSTGNSTGPHLHFEIRDFGRRANPLDYLAR